MDHNTLPTPQFELPTPQKPQGKELAAPLEADQNLTQVSEQKNMELPAAQAPAQAVLQDQAAAQTAVAATAKGAKGVVPDFSANGTAPIIDDALLAEDGDLIEKAWVQKAKAIVERTKANPYEQNREISRVKKEYIQKRYQKDVKLSDE